MLASGAKPDLPDGNGRFPEEAARRSGASAELLRLLAAPPAANGRRARTVRPNGTNRHPRRPDPRPRFSTAAQRSNPEILQRNGSVSGKNRIRNRFVLSGLRENTPQRAVKPFRANSARGDSPAAANALLQPDVAHGVKRLGKVRVFHEPVKTCFECSLFSAFFSSEKAARFRLFKHNSNLFGRIAFQSRLYQPLSGIGKRRQR